MWMNTVQRKCMEKTAGYPKTLPRVVQIGGANHSGDEGTLLVYETFISEYDIERVTTTHATAFRAIFVRYA